MVFYGWKTTKVKDGFRWTVTKNVSLKNPNKRGQYANTTIVKTGVRKTRAQAMGLAKQWKMYLAQQQRRRLR